MTYSKTHPAAEFSLHNTNNGEKQAKPWTKNIDGDNR